MHWLMVVDVCTGSLGDATFSSSINLQVSNIFLVLCPVEIGRNLPWSSPM